MRFAGVTVRACVALVLLCGSGAAWAKGHEMARDKFHPGRSQYRHWAQLVAQKVLLLAPDAPATDRLA